jgi:AcrR family transcriptional regulator
MPTPARTSVEEIVLAGRAIVESDGLDGLTMQRVAAAVGVKAPSLYKRVRNRQDLIRLFIEDVARDLTETLDRAATTGDPRRDLQDIADALRSFAHSQPTAYGLLFAQLPAESRPDQGVLAGTAVGVVRVAGFLAGPDEALEAARTIVAWAHGFISMELAGAFRLGGDIDRAYAFGVERIADALGR